jgi:hypothetical protein
MLKDCLPGQWIVLTVILLIGYIGISAQITCYQQLFQSSSNTLAVFVPLNVIVVMLLINYALVCNTDPGAVPINWVSRYAKNFPHFCSILIFFDLLGPPYSTTKFRSKEIKP